MKKSSTIDIAPQSVAPEQNSADFLSLVADELNMIHHDPGFVDLCARNDIDLTATDGETYAHAFDQYVSEYCALREEEGLMNRDHALLLQLGGGFAAATYAEREVKHMKKNKNWTPEEKRYFHDTLMPQVISYNRMLVEYYYSNPDTKISDVSLLMAESSVDMLQSVDVDEVRERVEALAKGCVTEAKTMQLFDRIGIPYQEGTIKEDARGGDVVIVLDGQRVLVDVKSSLDAMTGADLEKAKDALEAGKLYIVTGRNRLKLLMNFEKSTTGRISDDTSRDMVVAAQVQRGCIEAMAVAA